MDKRTSPFAGIKLSEPAPTPPTGPDQRLFSSRPPAPQPAKMLSKEPRKEGSLEPRNLGTLETKALHSQEGQPFDISKPAYQSNTYAFTEEELWAIEDTKNELQRHHDVKVTKYNLIRLGIHCLIEDFRREGKNSFVAKHLHSTEK